MPENTSEPKGDKKGGLKLVGEVSSNKMTNTVIVKIEQVKVHPKYKKRYRVTQKHAADTAGVQYQVGDKVEIMECKPISKTKNFVVTRKI
jgi:small subunit ribosomal protein S17